MIINLTSIWHSLPNFFSPFLWVVTVISVVICFVATLPKVRSIAIGEALMLFGAPILFFTVLFLATNGGRWFFDVSDFLAINIALGASYFLAREATHLPTRSIRIAGWIEIIAFAMVAGYFYLFCL